MKSIILNLIKIASIVVTSSAVLLDCWKFYLHQHQGFLPPPLEYLFWAGNVVIIAHAIEGIVAALIVENKNPLFYGIYTFFVGTIGLQELFNNNVKTLKN